MTSLNNRLYRTTFRVLMLGISLAGCVAMESSPENALPPKMTAAAPTIRGWDQVAALQPKFVVFGELHGTNESPKFVGDVAAMLATQGRRVLVAVELSANEDKRLQAAWKLLASEFALALRVGEWLDRRDGVTSLAMRDLLLRLHALNTVSGNVSFAAFNGYRDDGQRSRLHTPGSQTGHEAAQAENIIAASDANRPDITLVLVGSFHARRQVQQLRGTDVAPMAVHLGKAGKLISLNMTYAIGTAWNCLLKADLKRDPASPITDAMVDCASHPAKGYPATADDPYIALGPFQGQNWQGRFDGHYWVGAISGSEPAVQ